MSGVIGEIPFVVTNVRQWLVKHFEWSHDLEAMFTERLIQNDILNNSAWSHRFYTLFGNGATAEKKGDEVVDAEVEYAQRIIKLLPSNTAPWNYLRGYIPCRCPYSSVLKFNNRPLSTITTFAQEFAPVNNDSLLVQSTKDLRISPSDNIGSSASEVSTISVHALDVLAEIYAEKDKKLAKRYLGGLANKFDTMRKGYWEFRIEKLGDITVQ
jgi:protein farnesyltransferase/geranylgeranyltransferase type-1 subunit alpha